VVRKGARGEKKVKAGEAVVKSGVFWIRRILGNRKSVFVLAWLSFACLLGQFYGLWTMHVFGMCVLAPAIVLLLVAAMLHRNEGDGRSSTWTWVVQGTIGGLLAAIAYDLYRLPFVLNGAPLYKPFAKFGELLLGGNRPVWAVYSLGWAYHFSNGIALGIMFLVLASCFRRPWLVTGALLWALFVEAMLLLTPYAAFFGLQKNGRFLFLTASAHAVFGIVLGLYLRWRVPGQAPERNRFRT